LATFTKGKPAVRSVVRAGDRTLARTGNTAAKGRVVGREIRKNVD
jgi:hypothetical protein